VRFLAECRVGNVASCRQALERIPSDSRAPTDLRDVFMAYQAACDAGAPEWCVTLSILHRREDFGPPNLFAARSAADKACAAGERQGCLEAGTIAIVRGDVAGALPILRDLCREAPQVARRQPRRSRRNPGRSPRIQSCFRLVELYHRQPALAPAHCAAALEKFLCSRVGGHVCGRNDEALARMVNVPFPHECSAP
jgi:hypothetical protein